MILARLPTALAQKLRRFVSKDYRDGYLQTHVRSGIGLQIRALREKAKLSQTQFAEATGKKQSTISRIEDTEYGHVSVRTLLDIACAMDVALLVRFVDYPQFLKITADMSPKALSPDNVFESEAKAVGSENRAIRTDLFDPFRVQPQRDQENIPDEPRSLFEVFRRDEDSEEARWGAFWNAESDINRSPLDLGHRLN